MFEFTVQSESDMSHVYRNVSLGLKQPSLYGLEVSQVLYAEMRDKTIWFEKLKLPHNIQPVVNPRHVIILFGINFYFQ